MPNCFASRTVFTCASAAGDHEAAASAAPAASARRNNPSRRLIISSLPQGRFTPPGVLLLPARKA
jgi:hypothetical protein